MSSNGRQESSADTEPTTWLDGLPCTGCRRIVVPAPQLFDTYFDAGSTPCPFCNQPLDLWTQTITELKTLPTSWVAFRLLGALRTNRQISLEAGKSAEVDLSEFPAATEFLNVSVVPISRSEEWPVMPALGLQNELRLDPFPRRLRLYGIAHGQQGAVRSEVQLTVTWIDPGVEDVSVHHLVDAAKQFAAGRYKGMIIPANVAVEAALTPAVSVWTQTYCCKEEVDDFLGPRGATYAHQLNVLSRIAGRVLGIKPLPADIHALLDTLRRYRNDLGHRGVLDRPKRPPPDKAKAAEFLAAAVFGYHYALYMRRNVAQVRSTTDGANAATDE